jgi:hypothetical protein
MMNAQRLSKPLMYRSATVASWVIVWLATVGSASIENSGAATVEERDQPTLAVKLEPADATLPTFVEATDAPVIIVDAATEADAEHPATTEAAPVPDRPEQPVKLASADPTEIVPADAPSPQPAAVTLPEPAANDVRENATEAESPLEIVDECIVVDFCVDRYLWAIYQRTQKEDTIKVQDSRKVTVRRRGKTITVNRAFTRLVDEDFGWKDPKAADKAGMPLMDYVIGGMDRGFKLKLFHTLHAAEAAGLAPGITSAFRDDYRQSIASGLKAASNRSYHGGTLRGGYGHGLAADIVSVKGATRAQRWVATEDLWKWVDTHGKEFGIGRPYLDRDPPHVGPIDGQEYVSRRGGAKTEHVASEEKPRKRLAAHAERGSAKRAKTVARSAAKSAKASSSKVSSSKSARVRTS